MEIRLFNETDVNQIVSLFYETVHEVNKQDYSIEQLEAWAPLGERMLKLETWGESLSKNITYVAVINDIIVGFSDMTQKGYIDRLYVHKHYQGQGIATTLINALKLRANELELHELETAASITAIRFFENQGFRLIEKQVVERKGVELVNFKMVKKLLP